MFLNGILIHVSWFLSRQLTFTLQMTGFLSISHTSSLLMTCCLYHAAVLHEW